MRVRLPQTLDQFDQLTSRVCKKYRFTDIRHASAVISVAIRQLPPTQGYLTYDYLFQYITKSIANHVAHIKGQSAQHETQIDQLVSLLHDDPLNMQARDGLEKAVSEGSLYAKKALEEIDKAIA